MFINLLQLRLFAWGKACSFQSLWNCESGKVCENYACYILYKDRERIQAGSSLRDPCLQRERTVQIRRYGKRQRQGCHCYSKRYTELFGHISECDSADGRHSDKADYKSARRTYYWSNSALEATEYGNAYRTEQNINDRWNGCSCRTEIEPQRAIANVCNVTGTPEGIGIAICESTAVIAAKSAQSTIVVIFCLFIFFVPFHFVKRL